MKTYDLAVVGGGINGAGIAADAAGRGLSVALFEQSDLGSATSAASTKLVHGGLRYLETREFGLVRKALKESQLLLELAPHLIEPIDIFLPYQKHLRPWLLIRAGLVLYNLLAARPSYPKAKAFRFPPGGPLRDELTHGFSFSDGQVDDARLVLMNARQAHRHGADIFVRQRCTGLTENNERHCWTLDTQDTDDGATHNYSARVVVNAGGPWVSSLYSKTTGKTSARQLKMVKGSHILVPASYAGKQAYMLQNEDGRIAFVIPYQEKFTMIGTTEAEFTGDPAGANISDREIDYLLEIYNSYFEQPLNRQDISYTWAGVRPLIDDKETTATRTSRDFQLIYENTTLPLLSVYGGKLTTYRLLAKQAVDQVAGHFSGLPESRTDKDCLPGGDFENRPQLAGDLALRCNWLPEEMLSRWVASYGTLAYDLLEGCQGMADLGTDFGHGLTKREVDYQIDHEWARTVDDILYRRTKLGLLFNASQRQQLDNYLVQRLSEGLQTGAA